MMNNERIFLEIMPGPPEERKGFEPDAVGRFMPVLELLAGLLESAPGRTVSLELVCRKGKISFVVGVPTDWSKAIEHQLYAVYPLALVKCLKNDPLVLDGPAMVGADAKVAMSEVGGSNQISDGLIRSMLEALSGLTVTAGIQIVLAAPERGWASLVREVKQQIGEDVHGLFGREAEPAEDKEETPRRLLGHIRVVVSGETDEAEVLVERLGSLFNQGGVTGSVTKVSVRRWDGWIRSLHERRLDNRQAVGMSVAEVARLYVVPSLVDIFPQVKQLGSRQLPPPQTGQSGLLLGASCYRGNYEPVWLATEDRLRHLYLLGQTGTGKSTLFQSWMLQDLVAGEGGCFVDPHGEAIDWLLQRIPRKRLEDVLLFDPTDASGLLGLNMLEWRTAQERDFLIQELIGLFYTLFDPGRTGVIGPQFEHWLRCAALTVTEPGVRGTLVDIPRLFTDMRYQQLAVARSEHRMVKSFWLEQMRQTSPFHKSEMLNYFVSKFGSFLGNATIRELVSVRRSAFNVREMMDNHKVLLVNLSKGRLGELHSRLLGTLLMTRLQLAALSRADTPADQRVPFWVYVDEFHTMATDTFAGMLSEVRKYKVGFHLTHQYARQLPESVAQAVTGNVGTMCALRLGTEDADWLSGHFKPLQAQELRSVSPYHLHVKTLVNGQLTAPFTMRSLPLTGVPQPAIEQVIRGRVRRTAAMQQTGRTRMAMPELQ